MSLLKQHPQQQQHQFNPEQVLPNLAVLQRRLLEMGFTYIDNQISGMQRSLAGGGIMTISFTLTGVALQTTRAMAVEKRATVQYLGDEWVSIILNKVTNLAGMYVQADKVLPNVGNLFKKGL